MSLSLEITPYRVPLAPPIRTSRSVVSTRVGWRVKLMCTRTQHCGWGEIACWSGFGSGYELTHMVLSSLSTHACKILDALERCALSDPQQHCSLQDIKEACLSIESLEVRYGIELAALDLRARTLGIPLVDLLSSVDVLSYAAPTHCLIRTLQDAQRAVGQGYFALKLKVGVGAHWSEDGLLIAELAAYLDSLTNEVKLRLDANQAWSEVDAIGALVTARAYGVEWIEEPLQRALSEAQGWSIWQEIQQKTGAHLAVDESLQQSIIGEVLSVQTIENRLRSALEHGVKVVTLKPMFVGGLLSCADLARMALAHGAKVCLTHALEGAIGRRGVAHLCVALISEGYSIEGGLTGALPVDLMEPLEVQDGFALLPKKPGLGEIIRAES